MSQTIDPSRLELRRIPPPPPSRPREKVCPVEMTGKWRRLVDQSG